MISCAAGLLLVPVLVQGSVAGLSPVTEPLHSVNTLALLLVLVDLLAANLGGM